MKNFNHNRAAYNSGVQFSWEIDSQGRDYALGGYQACARAGDFTPSVSASVCFVAGYLGKRYPNHDDRVTS